MEKENSFDVRTLRPIVEKSIETMADNTKKVTINKLWVKFEADRVYWSGLIFDLAEDIKAVKSKQLYFEMESKMLSNRQQLAEYLAFLRDMSSANTVKVRESRGKKWDTHQSFESDRKTTSVVSGALAQESMIIDVIAAQTEFIENTISTLDKLGYSMKNLFSNEI